MLLIVTDTSQNSLMSPSYGVPHGSILGPSLFIIYLTYRILWKKNNVAWIEMYADDTVLHVSDSCVIKAMGQSNAAMDMLYLWCIRNKLTNNFSKTKHVNSKE